MAPLPDTNPILEGVRWKSVCFVLEARIVSSQVAQILPLRYGPHIERTPRYLVEVCFEGEERGHDPCSAVPVQRRAAKSE
jgi:hypothetical protein